MKNNIKVPITSLSYWIGIKHMKSKQWKKAVKYLGKSLKNRPKNSYINFKLGLCYLKLKKWQQAKKYIGEAIRNNPNKTEWYVQLEQAENRIVTPKNKKTPFKVKKNNNFIREFETALLNCDSNGRADFHNFIDYVLNNQNYINLIKSNKEMEYHILLQIEYDLSQEWFNENRLIKIIDSFSDTAFHRNYLTYIQALYLYRKSEFSEAFILLQHLHNSKPENIMSYFLAISSAVNLDNINIAKEISREIPTFSKRALAWRYLSLTSKSADTALSLYRLYTTKTNQGELSLGNVDVMKNVVFATYNNGLMSASRDILNRSLAFLLEHNNPSRFDRKRYRYSTEDYLPEWFYPFDNIEAEEIDSNFNRFNEVLIRTTNLLDNIDIKAFCDSNTLLAIYENDYQKLYQREIELSFISDENNTLNKVYKALINTGLYFPHITINDDHSIRIKHLLGITVSITQYNRIQDVYICNKQGIEIEHSNLEISPYYIKGGGEVYVPQDMSLHLKEIFGDLHSEFTTSFSFLTNRSNIERVQNKDNFIINLYIGLAEAKINGLEHEALKIIDILKLLDEENEIFTSKQEDVGCDIEPLEKILTYKPEVVIYLSGLENVAYQGNMWLSVLESLPCRVAIIIREARIANQLNKTELPVFFMQNMRDLEFLEESGVRTILYPGNSQKSTQSLRLHRLNHFFINHGESDKVVNQSKFLMAYDKLLVAGPLAEKRLREANLPLRDGQVVHVGRPQVELLLEQKKENTNVIKTILYAPTWEGFVEEANYTSVSDFGLTLLKELSKTGYEIYFKPHPYTGHNKNGDTKTYLDEMIKFSQKNNIVLVDPKETIFKYMNLCDLLITDISSVLNDFLYTQKPMILTNIRNIELEEFHLQYPSSQAAYIIDEPNSINSLLDSITKQDSLKKDRGFVLKESLGDIEEGYLNKFTRVILESIKQ